MLLGNTVATDCAMQTMCTLRLNADFVHSAVEATVVLHGNALRHVAKQL